MNRRLLVAVGIGLVIAALAGWFLLSGEGRAGAPKVAAENPCDAFPSLDGALADWMRQRRRLEPALTCEHFERIAEVTPLVSIASAWEDSGRILDSAPERWRSPNGRRLVLPSDGSTSLPELVLIDLEEGTKRVLFTGEGGLGWRDAGWMDDSSLVAAGETQGSAPGTVAPTLTLLRLDTNRATVFRGPNAVAMRFEDPPARR